MAGVLGFATFFLVQNLRTIFTSTRTQGTVIAYDSTYSANGKLMSRMNAEFFTKDGIRHEAHSTTRTSFSPKQEGARVTIYYKPTDPENAVIATFIDFWLHVVILETIGLVLFICWFGILKGVAVGASEYTTRIPAERYGPRDPPPANTPTHSLQN